MIKLKHLAFTSAVIFLSACGGGGGSSFNAQNTTPISKVSGVVKDGPIENALVYIDSNLNGKLDYIDSNSNSQLDFDIDSVIEPYSFTNKKGEYTIEGIFEDSKEYMVIVEGSSSYKTNDKEDNSDAGEALTFKMFSTFKTKNSSNNEQFLGKSYSVHVNPVSFKESLKQLNEDTFNSLDNSSTYSDIKSFINDSSIDNTELFKKYLKSTSSNVITSMDGLINELSEFIDIENKSSVSSSTNSLLNLSNDSIVSNNNANENNIFKKDNSTTKSSIANYSFSKKIDSSSLYKNTNTNSKSYITKYDSILQIPSFSSLKTSYAFVEGAHIKTNSSNLNDALVLSKLLDKIEFSNNDSLFLFQYDGSSWNQVSNEFNISENTLPSNITSSMSLRPFIIVKDIRSSKKTKVIDTSAFVSYDNPLLLVKNKKGEVIEYIEVNSAQTTINYDLDEEIDSIVLFSETIESITNDDLAISFHIEDEENIVLDNKKLDSFIVNGSSFDDIKDGNNIYGIYGLSSLIRTDIAYELIDIYNKAKSDEYTVFEESIINDSIVSVNFKRTISSSKSLENSYSQSELSYFEGVVVFNKDTKTLIKADYYQEVRLKNSVSGTNTLNGYLHIKDSKNDDIFTFEKGKYSFSIDNNVSGYKEYEITTNNPCNPRVKDDDNITNSSAIIKGNFTVSSASTKKPQGNASVDNVLKNVTITTSNKCQN